MSKMIPPYVSEDIKSTGERLIFELFRNDPDTADWVVLHSMGITRHTIKLYGEIDFVVLAPDLGIFCLEVKSGEIMRKEGQWIHINRYGEKHISNKCPFDQAQQGMFSLLKAITNEFGRESKISRLVYGYGVMFPHINYNPEGVNQEWWQIYDRDSRRLPINSFIKQLAKYTKRKIMHCDWFDKHASIPNKEDIKGIADFLRGDFEKLIKPQHLANDIEEQIQKYTSEQYICLDQMQDNPRCLFQGAAGTGKTMLAIEAAKRGVREGKRVLLICYNHLLGSWLEYNLMSLKAENKANVDSFHKYLYHRF